MSQSISPKFFSSSFNFLSPKNPSFEKTFIGETAPHSSMRDVLLNRCKSAIEELHQEIDDLQRSKSNIEEKSSRLDREMMEKENLLKQERYYKERLEEEINDLKSNFLSINEKASYLEEKLHYFQENEIKYEDLKRNFQMLCETNEDLKERLEDQIKETTRRDSLAKEWEDTLSNVNLNIRDLNLENEALKYEKNELIKQNEDLQLALDEKDTLKNSLDRQLGLVEQLRVELQEVQNALLERNEELNYERKEKENLRKLLDVADHNLREQLKEQDRNAISRVNEIEALLTDRHKCEMNQFKEEMLRSLERMETIKNKTDEELTKLKEEKESLKQDCKLLSEKVVQKDSELRDLNEKIRRKGDDSQRETGKIQKIIEDQNEIITKLEKIIEKERNEKNLILKENEETKNNIRQYIEKNAFLTEKLKASHQEIENISKDVRKTFETEDEKNLVYHKRIRELEGVLLEKDKTYEVLNKEYMRIKGNVKKQKVDFANITQENKELREEINRSQTKIVEIMRENEALRGKHRDFQEELKERMDECSNDVKLERENRMQEQRYARELEDKIMTIENQYKNELNFLKTELLRKERECEKLKIKHDDLNFTLMNNQNKFNSGVLSSGDERKYEPINEEIEFEKPEKELNEIKGHLDRFDNVSLKEKIKRQMEDDKKNFSLNSRIPETGEFITARTNNPQSREFIDRFKGFAVGGLRIINKLEDKLSKMSYELKSSDTFE